MQIWWDQLTKLDQVLYYIAVPSTIALLIQTIMTFIGMGGDGDFDGDLGGEVSDASEFDGDFEVSFEIFTVRNFVAFFTFFSWGGLWASSSGQNSDIFVIFLALISGIMAMFISGGLFYFMKRMTSSGTLDLKYALGKVGEVYIPIPADKLGVGKVQILIQGALREVEAVTDSQERLETGSSIKVIDLLNESVLIVQKY